MCILSSSGEGDEFPRELQAPIAVADDLLEASALAARLAPATDAAEAESTAVALEPSADAGSDSVSVWFILCVI